MVEKLDEDRCMCFKDNKSRNEMIIDRRLGLIKYHLMEKEGVTQEQKLVKIRWDLKQVKLRGEVVAWMQDDVMKYDKGIEQVNAEAETAMKTWLEKRDGDRQ